MDRLGSYRVAHHESLGSTNDEAMALLRRGDPGGLFVVADRQTGGRGRQGRAWVSPSGNLYASLALVDPSLVGVAPQLGFVAGVALAGALRGLLGDDDRLQIKWPNDIVFEGAKLSGLLLESTALPDNRLACVIGFGVNCVSHPDGLAYRATNLAAASGRSLSPATVLAALVDEMEAQLAAWDRGAGFATIRSRWLGLAAGIGQPVKVVTPRDTIAGTLVGIDPGGRLVVHRDQSGLTHHDRVMQDRVTQDRVMIDAGDVFLPGLTAGAMNS